MELSTSSNINSFSFLDLVKKNKWIIVLELDNLAGTIPYIRVTVKWGLNDLWILINVKISFAGTYPQVPFYVMVVKIDKSHKNKNFMTFDIHLIVMQFIF